MSAGHPQITQCKQCHELRGVLGQSLVAHLVESELALDDSERVLHLGPHTGFELLSLIEQFLSSARRLPWRIANCHSTPVASARLVTP